MERLTRIELLSLKYLFISPSIIGTAYVENCTFCDKSKLSIALIIPIHPIWNKSSMFSFDWLKRCTMLNTRRRLPLINCSRAFASPCLIFFKSSSFSFAFNSGSSAVLTPHISTLYPAKLHLLYQYN